MAAILYIEFLKFAIFNYVTCVDSKFPFVRPSYWICEILIFGHVIIRDRDFFMAILLYLYRNSSELDDLYCIDDNYDSENGHMMKNPNFTSPRQH